MFGWLLILRGGEDRKGFKSPLDLCSFCKTSENVSVVYFLCSSSVFSGLSRRISVKEKKE